MIFFQKVEEAGDGQQVGAAAGADALHDETAVLGKGLVELQAGIKALQEAVAAADPAAVLAKMGALRTVADGLETVVSDARWPLPKYRTMLFLY